MNKSISIFIGYDPRERAATNVLIDSLYQNSSLPISINPLVTPQLEQAGLYWRKKDPKQSTAFSFTRFLVPYLMNYEGWAIFIDCDMLCVEDISNLWSKKEDKFSILCVKHKHIPKELTKFQGEIQSSYPKKNWSSMLLFNCKKCTNLTPEYVNTASGLELHRFLWLKGDHEIGSIDSAWNHLAGVENDIEIKEEIKPKLIHWTLGGPWFKDQRLLGGELAAKWFAARDDAMKLWD